MQLSPRSRKIIASALALGFAGLVASAHASLQFSDGFVYNTGALAGNTPPVGASSAWTTPTATRR